MADLMRWQGLKCSCGHAEFYDVFELKRHPQGGLAKDALKQRCVRCHKEADTGAMLQALHLQRQREHLAALEQELELATTVPPALPSSATS